MGAVSRDAQQCMAFMMGTVDYRLLRTHKGRMVGGGVDWGAEERVPWGEL